MAGEPTDDFGKAGYWDETAEYDLETARAMQRAARYLYVGFMCHQTVEKKLKGKFVKSRPEDDLPFIHNLVRLAKAAGVYDSLSGGQQKLLLDLEPMNVEARYPRKRDEVYRSLTKERCEQLVRDTEEFAKWIDEN